MFVHHQLPLFGDLLQRTDLQITGIIRCQAIKNSPVEYEKASVDETISIPGFLAEGFYAIAVYFKLTEAGGG